MISIPQSTLLGDGKVDRVDDVAGIAGAGLIEDSQHHEADIGRKTFVFSALKSRRRSRSAPRRACRDRSRRRVGLGTPPLVKSNSTAWSRSPLLVNPESSNATVTPAPVYGVARTRTALPKRFLSSPSVPSRCSSDNRFVVEALHGCVGRHVHDVGVPLDLAEAGDRHLRLEQIRRRRESHRTQRPAGPTAIVVREARCRAGTWTAPFPVPGKHCPVGEHQ